MLFLPFILAWSPVKSSTEKGTEAYAAGKYGDALEAFKKAAEGNPDKAEAHYNLGDAFYKKGEYDNALKEYEEAVKLKPDMAEAYYNMGDTLYRKGQYDQALAAFRKADSLKGKDADTEHNITVTLKKVKQEKEEQEQKGQQQPMKTSGGSQKGGQGQSKQNRDDAGQRKNNQTAGGKGQNIQGPPSGQPQTGPRQAPMMSSGEVQTLLDRQRREEKSLRRYFRPGKKDGGSGSEDEVEQMLRAAGVRVPTAREARPGAPKVEKDW